MKTAKATRRASRICVVWLSTVLLGGCLGFGDHPVASVAPVDLRTSTEPAAARPPIKTARRSTAQVADADDLLPRGGALPSPSEIFDFHPAGSKPDTWRQPFVIDPNDGPLAGYVRRMDAELTESNSQVHAAAAAPVRKKVCPSGGPVGAISTTCGENDVAKSLAR